MTVTEKILAKASKKAVVFPGEIVKAKVDKAMIHDNNAPLVMKHFSKIVVDQVWDPERIVFVVDHHSPCTSIKAAQHQAEMREFARKQGVKKFFDCGEGICHVLMLEKGLAGPGQVIVGTDSHTTGEGALGSFATGIGATEMAGVLATGEIWLRVPETIKVEINGDIPSGSDARDVISLVLQKIGASGANYLAVEFTGTTVEKMDLSEKTTLCVMSMEMGAKNAVIVPAEGKNTGDHLESDPDAGYYAHLVFDVADLEPLVACPSLPTNIRKVEEVEKDRIFINQAAVSSCAGAQLRDLKAAAEILKNKKIAENVRLLVIPASREIYNQAMHEGYLNILHDAGAIISSPACGACGAHDIGALAPGEVCISSTTRNMPGRMGPGGEIYLASAATVAASALKGYICDPRKVV
ncbi:MAG: aconitase/3-isopropylmalate dehydratase large subunit family protein [Peptococcaceae bacterium]